MLNYLGQGALLLRDPEAARNPFYLLAPDWALYPLVVLATVAAVIASQALISGAFSLTRQAMQLGYCPRMEVVHTSAEEMGQIYLPGLNWMLLVGVIAAGAGLPLVQRAGGGVRHRGDGDDGHHHDADLRGGARALGREPGGGAADRRRCSCWWTWPSSAPTR